MGWWNAQEARWTPGVFIAYLDLPECSGEHSALFDHCWPHLKPLQLLSPWISMMLYLHFGQVSVLNQILMLEEWRKGSLIFLDGAQEKRKLAGSSFSLHCWMYIVVLWNCGFEWCLCITQHTSVYVWYQSLGLTGDVDEGWSVLFQELSMARCCASLCYSSQL